jgi:acyl carrier protein
MRKKLSVVEIIQRYTALPLEVITDDAELVKDLGADSITLMEIVSTIESQYGVDEPSTDELAEIKTVGDAKDMVRKLIGE